MKIFTIADKKEEKFLRQKTAEFDFGGFTKKEINELIKKMRETMPEAIGIGLSANQVGLNLRLFIAQMPQISTDKTQINADKKISVNLRSNQRESAFGKFYAIFNPEIIKFSEKKIAIGEGCLSVPGIYGIVERPEKITLIGSDKNNKKIKIKAFGLLSRVFQHETDHLNGILFIDKCKKIYKIHNN